MVGAQYDDVLKTSLRPTDQEDDPNDHQDQDECSKTDIHGSQLSRVTGCATQISTPDGVLWLSGPRGAYAGPWLTNLLISQREPLDG